MWVGLDWMEFRGRLLSYFDGDASFVWMVSHPDSLPDHFGSLLRASFLLSSCSACSWAFDFHCHRALVHGPYEEAGVTNATTYPLVRHD